MMPCLSLAAPGDDEAARHELRHGGDRARPDVQHALPGRPTARRLREAHTRRLRGVAGRIDLKDLDHH